MESEHKSQQNSRAVTVISNADQLPTCPRVWLRCATAQSFRFGVLINGNKSTILQRSWKAKARINPWINPEIHAGERAHWIYFRDSPRGPSNFSEELLKFPVNQMGRICGRICDIFKLFLEYLTGVTFSPLRTSIGLIVRRAVGPEAEHG